MAATATFDYQVRDRQGKIVKGRIEADNEAAVAMKLRSMGYAPVTISQSNAGMKREINIHIGSGVKLKDLAVMSRQLSTMINSGLSLLRALTILADQTSNKVLRERLADVRNDVEGGTALSVALAAHPKIFPPLMINMVRAGEVGGFLDGVLLQLADNYEKEVRLRGKIKSAMAYPTVIFIIAVLAVVAMLLFIVPIFGEMFASLGGELPAPTRLLQTMSDILKTYFPLFLLGLIVLVVLWARFRHHPRVRDVVDPLKLKVPVFGSLNRKIALSRFTRNLGTMIHSGVPILQALDIVADTSGSVVVARAVREVQESVRQGESISKPLARHSVFPPMVVQMIAVGEDTGALDTMLAKISDFYDQEVETTTESLTALIEPLMIVVVGGMVGSMIIALYLPIFTIFNLIK